MSREPLPSRHAVKQFVPGVGPQTDSRLQQMDQGAANNNAPPVRDQFCSAAAAMLVALLKHEEAAEAAGGGAEAKLCPKSTLLERAAALCEQRFLPLSAHVSAAGDKLKGCGCSAFQQMTTLQTLLLVEQKQRKAACTTGLVYRLSEAGRERAAQLRRYGEAGEAQPLRHHRRIAAGEAGVAVLLVDEREGGGQAHAKFHALCDALEREGARFETCRLPEGDYLWVEQRAGAGGGAVQVRELPRLIERKAANDVAASLKDGRWSRQQARMAAHSARAHRGGARLEYIIEDEVSREVHAC